MENSFDKTNADNFADQSKSISTASEVIKELMPRPLLLPGESEDELKAFHQGFIEATNPSEIIEHVFVQEVSDYTWEMARFRRMKVSTINSARREAVEKILFPCLFDGERGHTDSINLARVLAHGWSSGKDDVRKMAIEILDAHGYGESDIQAVCYSLRIDEIESIDRLISVSECRRNGALKELERHRDSTARRAREYSERAISNAEIVEDAP